MSHMETLRWWGWGRVGEGFDLPDPQGFWSSLEQALGPLEPDLRISSLSDVPLAPGRLSPEGLALLEKLFATGDVSVDPEQRLLHALGKSYLDLLRLRRGWIEAAPDAVVFPRSEEQILGLLRAAVDRGWSVVTYGGGTSVVGGVEPISEGRPVVTVDLKNMNRIVYIDRISHTARAESGIRGPELETRLQAGGFTLGHFPQSFEFSTLGGWIATRGAGQNSTKYGKIEHMVVSLRMVTPEGVLDCPVVPAQAVGPSLLYNLVGSEGTLGVITEAVVRIRPIPRERLFAAYLFPDFATGMAAVRQMLQAEVCPAILRLSDPDETALALRLGRRSPGHSFKERLGRWYVRCRGFDLQESALLIMVFEGSRRLVSAAGREARRFLRSGLYLGSEPARLWMKSRFRHPYLRDELLDRSLMVDTLETAAPWAKLPVLYAAVRRALTDSILKTAPGALVLAHLSHAYPDGASLYFTFLARQQKGRELEQWRKVKEAATRAILASGGALSHHHGIGILHKPWVQEYLGSEGLALLRQLKARLDPHGIMNPGKLMGDRNVSS